jgi:hypothetical protein
LGNEKRGGGDYFPNDQPEFRAVLTVKKMWKLRERSCAASRRVAESSVRVEGQARWDDAGRRREQARGMGRGGGDST